MAEPTLSQVFTEANFWIDSSHVRGLGGCRFKFRLGVHVYLASPPQQRVTIVARHLVEDARGIHLVYGIERQRLDTNATEHLLVGEDQLVAEVPAFGATCSRRDRIYRMIWEWLSGPREEKHGKSLIQLVAEIDKLLEVPASASMSPSPSPEAIRTVVLERLERFNSWQPIFSLGLMPSHINAIDDTANQIADEIAKLLGVSS